MADVVTAYHFVVFHCLVDTHIIALAKTPFLLQDFPACHLVVFHCLVDMCNTPSLLQDFNLSSAFFFVD